METPVQTTEQTVETPVQTAQETQETPVVDQNIQEPVVEPVLVPPVTPEPPAETPTDPFASLTPEQIVQHFGKDEQQKTALLKAFGLDDFILGANDYYRKTGGLAEYAEVKSVDYNKVPDEKIVERKLREQYANAGLSEEELGILIEDEMQNRFKLDAELHSERDVQISKAKLKVEAAEFRKTLIDRQQQFKAPERVEEPIQAVSPEQQVAAVRNQVLGDAGVQQFMQAKKLQFGDAQSQYNYEVQNPQDTLAIMYDVNAYHNYVSQKNAQGQVIMNPDGSPKLDYAKLLKVATYVQNMDAIEKNLIAHGANLERKRMKDEAENVKIVKNDGAQGEPETLWTKLHQKLQGK